MKIKNVVFGVGLLLVGVSLGIGAITYLPQLKSLVKTNPLQTVIPTPTINIAEEKKQTLVKFYNEIITAQDKQDWATLYKLVPQSVRDNVTEAQFATFYSDQMGKDKVASKETIVNSVEVTGDTGVVNRTIVTCLAKECTGKNRTEVNAKKQYEHVDGKWQVPDPKASDKALEASSYIYMNSSDAEQKKIRDDWGYSSENASFATKNLAIYFDQNPDKLSLAEAWIDKNKADRSRPVVNYQPPAINYQPPAVIQQPSYPKNCTSNTIGSFTYTNCY